MWPDVRDCEGMAKVQPTVRTNAIVMNCLITYNVVENLLLINGITLCQ